MVSLLQNLSLASMIDPTSFEFRLALPYWLCYEGPDSFWLADNPHFFPWGSVIPVCLSGIWW